MVAKGVKKRDKRTEERGKDEKENKPSFSKSSPPESNSITT